MGDPTRPPRPEGVTCTICAVEALLRYDETMAAWLWACEAHGGGFCQTVVDTASVSV